jgi:hypothetical protein
MLKRFFPVWAPALALTFAVAFLPACQKEALETITGDLTTASVGVQERGPGTSPLAEHHRRRGPHGDSIGTHPHDSLHLCDTTRGPRRPHPLDSLFGPHGPHGPHDTLVNGGCRVQPLKIAVTDLPQPAQAWLAANAAGREIAIITKVTKRDCTIEYVVRFRGPGSVTFDAAGNKK